MGDEEEDRTLRQALVSAQMKVESIVPDPNGSAPFPVLSFPQVARKAKNALIGENLAVTVTFPEPPEATASSQNSVTVYLPCDLTVRQETGEEEQVTIRAWGSSDDTKGNAVEQAQTTALKQCLLKVLLMTPEASGGGRRRGGSGGGASRDEPSEGQVDGVELVSAYDDLKSACQQLGLSEQQIQKIVDGCNGEVQRVRKVLKRKLEQQEDVDEEEIPF